jgi:hypothetical protein
VKAWHIELKAQTSVAIGKGVSLWADWKTNLWTRFIRDQVEAHLDRLKKTGLDPQLWAEMEARVRSDVTRALTKFASLDFEIDQIDSGKKSKAVRREFNRATAEMRSILADYLRLALVHISEKKAAIRGRRLERRAFWLRQRLIGPQGQ